MTIKAAALIILASQTLRAETGTLELKTYLKEVGERNPAIVSAIKNYEAAQAGRAAIWIPPNPSLEFEKMNVDGPEERSFFLKQYIPNPLKIYVRRDISLVRADYARANYLVVRNSTLALAEEAFYSYHLAIQREKAYSKLTSLLDSVSRISEATYATGKEKAAYAIRVRTEYIRLKNMLAAAERERKRAGELLVFFLGSSDPPQTPKVEEDSLSLDQYGESNDFPAWKNPEILREKVKARKAKLEFKEAKYSYYPDFMAGYRRRTYGNMDGTYDVMFGITLPIFFFANKARSQEFDELKAASESGLDYVMLENVYHWKKSLFDLLSARDLALAYRDSILPRTELNFRNELSLCESGKGDIRDALDFIREYIDSELSYYQYLEKYYIARTKLKKLAGEFYEEWDHKE